MLISSDRQLKNNENDVVSSWVSREKKRSRGDGEWQKEGAVQILFQPDIKVTISNGICKVYDIIRAPFSLIARSYRDRAEF